MLLYRCHKCAPSIEWSDMGLALCHMIDSHRMLPYIAREYLSEYSIDTTDPDVDTIGQLTGEDFDGSSITSRG